MKFQAYVKAKPIGTPKTAKQRIQIDRCINGIIWEVLTK